MEEEWLPEATKAEHMPIINQIERGDWNGAKKNVLKRMQKSKDTKYPALLLFIQAHQPVNTENTEAFLRLQFLANDKDASNTERITEEEDLEIYEYAAKELSKGGRGEELSQFIGKIRLLAVQKDPANKQFADACLKKCVNESNFEVALQICLTLVKNFPKDRKYMFGQQVMRLLLSCSPHIDVRTRQMNVTIATLTLAKYAKAMTDAQGSTLPFHSLQNAQEILLYHHALKMSDKDDELINALLGPKIGVNSEIIKGDWAVMKSLVDELLRSDGPDATPKTWKLCIDLLEKACANQEGKIVEPMYGDWCVWSAFIDAIMLATDGGIQDIPLLEKFMELNNKHRFSKPAINKTNRRNACLASVKFMVMLDPKREEDTWTFKAYEHRQLAPMLHELEGRDGAESKGPKKIEPYVVRNVSRRLLTILEYLHEYGHVPAVFTDIKPYYILLDLHEREQLLGMATVVMCDRRGWSCVEHDDDVESPKTVNFPPTVPAQDQAIAYINLSKLSFLNAHIPRTYDLKSQAEKAQFEKDMSQDHFMCYNCRIEVINKDRTTNLWCQKRSLCCENCLKVITLHGMRLYDRALNGWPEKIWSPFAMKKTDMHPGDDAVIIAAMALIKLGGNSKIVNEFFPRKSEQTDDDFAVRHSTMRLIQAAAILEFAHTQSPANPQILLLLVRLWLVLGAGSLAMRAYSRLNLKRVQGETLGYILLDRISSIHPHPCDDIMAGDEPVEFDPATELAKLHREYRSFQNQISRNFMTCLQMEKYGSIFQLIDVMEKLHNSIARVMSVVELRKLTRLTAPDTKFTKGSHGWDILPLGVMKQELEDNIDYKSFPSYDLPDHDSDASFVHVFLETGPKPSDERMRASLLIEELMMITKAPYDSRANITQLILDLKQNLSDFRSSDAAQRLLQPGSNKITAAEIPYFTVAFHLMQMVTEFGCRDKHAQRNDNVWSDSSLAAIRKALENIKLYTEQGMSYSGIPDFDVLHPLYVGHQTAKMVMAVGKLLAHESFNQKNDRPHIRLERFLVGPATEALDAIQAASRKVKENMDRGGHLDTIVECVNEYPDEDDPIFTEKVVDDDYSKATIGKALRRVLTPEFVEVFASELVASWNESIIGLQCLC